MYEAYCALCITKVISYDMDYGSIVFISDITIKSINIDV